MPAVLAPGWERACKALTSVISANLPNGPVKLVFVCPFHWWGSWGSDQWRDLSKLHKQSWRVGVGKLVHPTHQFFPLHHAAFNNEKFPAPRRALPQILHSFLCGHTSSLIAPVPAGTAWDDPSERTSQPPVLPPHPVLQGLVLASGGETGLPHGWCSTSSATLTRPPHCTLDRPLDCD